MSMDLRLGYIEWKLPISEILQFQNVVYIQSSVYEEGSDDDITFHITGDIRSLLYGENVKGKKIPSFVLYSDHGLLYENMLGGIFESMFYGSNGETFYSIDGYGYHDGYYDTPPERYLRHYMSVIPNGATKPRWQLYFGGVN